MIAIGIWVATPDGEGEVVDYDPELARPYYVQLNRAGADASADNLMTYTTDEIQPASAPAWKLLRDAAASTD